MQRPTRRKSLSPHSPVRTRSVSREGTEKKVLKQKPGRPKSVGKSIMSTTINSTQSEGTDPIATAQSTVTSNITTVVSSLSVVSSGNGSREGISPNRGGSEENRTNEGDRALPHSVSRELPNAHISSAVTQILSESTQLPAISTVSMRNLLQVDRSNLITSMSNNNTNLNRSTAGIQIPQSEGPNVNNLATSGRGSVFS